MKLISMNVSGNVHEAVQCVNQLGLAHLFHSIGHPGASSCVVIFKTTSYPDYLRLCAKIGCEPMTTEEYFK